MAIDFTPPAPARQDALFHMQGRSEGNGATNKERQACVRRRDGEPAVSDTLRV